MKSISWAGIGVGLVIGIIFLTSFSDFKVGAIAGAIAGTIACVVVSRVDYQ
jgi:uncharacterized membrane protein